MISKKEKIIYPELGSSQYCPPYILKLYHIPLLYYVALFLSYNIVIPSSMVCIVGPEFPSGYLVSDVFMRLQWLVG